MFPLFKPNDELIVSHKEPYIEVGDILLLSEGAEFFAHRVIDIEDHILTKGDRSQQLESVSINNSFGKICGVKRSGKTILWGAKGQPL